MATYPIDEGYVPEYHTGRRYSTQDQVIMINEPFNRFSPEMTNESKSVIFIWSEFRNIFRLQLEQTVVDLPEA